MRLKEGEWDGNIRPIQSGEPKEVMMDFVQPGVGCGNTDHFIKIPLAKTGLLPARIKHGDLYYCGVARDEVDSRAPNVSWPLFRPWPI